MLAALAPPAAPEFSWRYCTLCKAVPSQPCRNPLTGVPLAWAHGARAPPRQFL